MHIDLLLKSILDRGSMDAVDEYYGKVFFTYRNGKKQPIDTESLENVRHEVIRLFSTVHGNATEEAQIFAASIGSLLKYAYDTFHHAQKRVGTPYHNWEHTAQAVIAQTRLYEGLAHPEELPEELGYVRQFRLQPKHFFTAFLQALFHDIAVKGNTPNHELEGSRYIGKNLESILFGIPELGSRYDAREAAYFVSRAILVTGMHPQVSAVQDFSEPERTIALTLYPADLLGQMSAYDYPKKLIYLFQEDSNRQEYRTAKDFLRTNAPFYADVQRNLSQQFRNLHTLMPRQYGYLELVEKNVEKLRKPKIVDKLVRFYGW